MIQVRDNRGNYHDALAIYDNAGREIKEVRNNQGRLLFKNWNEIHGSVPLSFMSRGGYLKDYRIYGNTVQNGTPTPENPVEVQGCGVKTTNLINIEQHNTGNVSKSSDGSYFVYSYDKWCWCIPTEIGKTYCVSVSLMNEYKNGTNLEIALCKGYRTPYTPNGSAIIRASLKDVEAYKIHTRTFKFTATDEWLSINGMSTYVYTIMINEGSAALPYEPYGYKIPVTVSDGRNAVTTPVYIGSEPLYLNEYVSYGEQQIYKNANGVLTPIEPPVPIPAITTASGENILTTETTVQPSNIWINGKIKAIN